MSLGYNTVLMMMHVAEPRITSVFGKQILCECFRPADIEHVTILTTWAEIRLGGQKLHGYIITYIYVVICCLIRIIILFKGMHLMHLVERSSVIPDGHGKGV